MPTTGPKSVCKAANAFRLEKLLFQVFLEPNIARPLHRCFSCSRYHQQLEAIAPVKAPESTGENGFTGNKSPSWRTSPKLPTKEAQELHLRHKNNIDPSSLSNTLQLHREANQAALPSIRKIPAKANVSAGFMTPPSAAWKVRKVMRKIERAARTTDTAEQEEKASVDIIKANDPYPEIFGDKEVEKAWFQHLNIDIDLSDGHGEKKDKIVSNKLLGREQKITLDYDGRYVLPFAKETAAIEDIPWYIRNQSVHGMQRLDQELGLFYKYARPPEKEQVARNKVLEELLRLIKKTLPDCEAEAMGSHKSGLSMTYSDLDVRLFKTPRPETLPERAPRHRIRKTLLPDLHKLLYVLKDHADYKIASLRHARYPLVSTLHTKSGLEIQVVCANDTGNSRSLIQQYLYEDPDLFPLFSAVRTALEVRGLTDVFRGGLGSYSIFMMIVASLKLHSRASKTVGEKLMDFLSFYGKLDLYKEAIAIDPPAKYQKVYPGFMFDGKTRKAMAKDERIKARYQLGLINHLEPFLLCIQDPADPLNDLGHKAFGIKHIQETLKQLHLDLENRICDPPRDTPYILLGPALANAYSTIARRRAMLESYAR